MNNEAFNRDLKIGEDGEEYILAIIRKKYPMAHKVSGKFKPYDIYIPEISSSFEVKTDSKAHLTGNVFIEIIYNYEPSGVLATKADKWAYITNDDVIYIKPERIKDCILFNCLKCMEFPPNDDSAQKRGFVISRELFDKFADKVVKKNA